ncbi:MAG: glycosyl hydrolase family 3 [Ruminococcus sp.]|nr:glycosyl hydrolase family 3 [Ruminococcus sp.]
MDLTARPFFLNEEEINWVNKVKQSLTVEQKIGQMFCVMGQDYTIEQLQDMVSGQGVGAILFRPAPAKDIREWYEKLDAAAVVPLLKAANLEEGGSGGTTDATFFGWPMAVGASDNPDMVEKFARLTAAEGRSVGINWTFSPVADLDLNYLNPITNIRSYGSDVERVLKFTQIFAQTMQKNGIAACAKHFPGDGVDYRDHHLHPTYNSLSAEKWYGSYGKVYENLIAHDIMSIMVGHIVQPEVSMDVNPELTYKDCLPASQSKEMLTGILRNRFGFNGVITSDATIMGGYCMSMERKEAIPASIMAGCDMLVFNTDFQEDYRYMLEAYQNGRLTEERLDEAVTRILALKAKVAWKKEAPQSDDSILENAVKWQKECAGQSITLVKNNTKIVPFTKDDYQKIRLILLGNEQTCDGNIGDIATGYLMQHGFEVEMYHPMEDDLHGTGSLDENMLTLYLANIETASNNTTVRINWCRKHALDIPRFVNEEKSVFISFANPYHLQDIPRVKTYINAYSANRPIIEAALEKILGISEFKGVSPVDAFCGLEDTKL